MSNFKDEFIRLISIINNPQTPNAERNSAENLIKQYANENISNFSILLSDILSQNDTSLTVKNFSGVVLKNIILGNYIQNKNWYSSITNEHRQYIKSGLFNGLGHSDIKIVRLFAMCIASICKIEFQNRENLDLIDQLSSIGSDNNQQECYRISAMCTLKLILSDVNSSEISDKMIKVASAIYTNLESNNKSLLNETLETLLYSIKGLSEVMKNEELKNSVFKMIYYGVDKLNTDEDLFLILIKCIRECGTYYYDYLENEISRIYDITSNIITNSKSNDQLVIQAYEFWISISSNEKKIIKYGLNCNKQYITLCQDNLLKFSIQTMLSTPISDLNNNDDNEQPIKSVYILIRNISHCCTDSFIRNILGNIESMININNNINHRIIGNILLSQILESPLYMNEKIIYINSQLEGYISMLFSSEVSQIKHSVLEIILIISKLYIVHFNKNVVKFILSSLINQLKSYSNDNLVLSKIISCIEYIFQNQNVRLDDDYNSEREELLILLYNYLVDIDRYDSITDIPNRASSAISAIIESSSSNMNIIIDEFLLKMIQTFKITLNEDFSSITMKHYMQSIVVIILGACLIGPERNRINMNNAVMIFNLISSSFDNRKEIYVEALYVINSLIPSKFYIFKLLLMTTYTTHLLI